MRRVKIDLRLIVLLLLIIVIVYFLAIHTNNDYENLELNDSCIENEYLEEVDNELDMIQNNDEISESIVKEDIQDTVELKVNLRVYVFNEDEVDTIAKTLYGECRGVASKMERAAVVWCILNRVDKEEKSIIDIITSPYQFVGYDANNPVLPELKDLAMDVLSRWYLEQEGVDHVGRVLPSNYLWFSGKNGRNWFRCVYESTEYWDWSYENPYDN